ncbi:hypothetical protein RKE29_21920 [Streptomyces sp. B1866]|uniref:hypothetical protein n=1 Tax=Streptomyces sp. B1866 TaxID=3075431 RepID=UPI0028909BB6|nr:hypothetical protein [Streptomyces sp. B1866]MDT3399274.1 hypothetical protein [Streptomyces sp. B1866]
MRSTDRGRELLRWLWTHETALRKWPEMMSAIPPHCADVVAWLIQQYLSSWQHLLEDYGGDSEAFGPAATGLRHRDRLRQ